MDFKNLPPDWEVQGTEPPEELRKTKGWLAGYKPPASYFNWFWNKCYLCLKELQEKLTGLETKHNTDVANTNAEVNKRLPLTGGKMTGAITNDLSETQAVIKNSTGGQLWLLNANSTSYKGGFIVRSRDTDGTFKDLLGKSDGSLTWNGKNIVRSVNNINADANGNVTLDVATSGHTHSDYLPKAGGTMNGAILSSTSVFVTNSANKTSALVLSGETPNANGASLQLYPVTNTSHSGGFQLGVRNTNDTANLWLVGKSDGSLVWNSKNIVRSVNGANADASGNVAITSLKNGNKTVSLDANGNLVSNGYRITRDVDDESIYLVGGTSPDTSSYINVLGGSNSNGGKIQMYAKKADGTAAVLSIDAEGELSFMARDISNPVKDIADNNGSVSVKFADNSTKTLGSYLSKNGGAMTGSIEWNGVPLIGKANGSLSWGDKKILTGNDVMVHMESGADANVHLPTGGTWDAMVMKRQASNGQIAEMTIFDNVAGGSYLSTVQSGYAVYVVAVRHID